MTDGIHPTVNRMQPSGLEPPLDRAAREPELGELPARHDAMLARRKCSGPGVRPARSTFTTTMGSRSNASAMPRILATDR